MPRSRLVTAPTFGGLPLTRKYSHPGYWVVLKINLEQCVHSFLTQCGCCQTTPPDVGYAPAPATVAIADSCGILTGLQRVFAQRKPTLLFLLSGAFLLRLAQRRLLRLFCHEPPRT